MARILDLKPRRPVAQAMSRLSDFYQAVAKPCILDGELTIFHERGLRDHDPAGFSRHFEFARAYRICLKEERRSSSLAVIKERRCSALPMVLLGASLFLPLKAGAADPSHELAAQPVMIQLERHDRSPRPSTRDEKTLRDLIGWIGEQGVGLQAVERMPALVRVGQRELLALAFGNKLPRAINRSTLKIYGLYNFENESIYLLDSIDLDSQRGRTILLHEVVHYLQYQTGASDRVQCKNELEPLAYQLEARYLADHNHHVDFSYGRMRRFGRCSSLM